MKILITGANGMLGKALQRELLDHEIVQHTRYISDLSKVEDGHLFYEFVSRVKPDYVIHTAALVGGLNYNKDNPYDFMTKNSVINNTVLDACVKYKVPRFLGILSVCCYGDDFEDKDYPLTEDKIFKKEPHPTNEAYAYSKRQLAKTILAANKQFGHRYNYIIPCNLYGIHDARGANAHFCSMMIDKLITAVDNGEDKITFVGNPEARRQYILVDDLAKIINRHVELDIDDNYNVASDEELYALGMINNLMVGVGQRKEVVFTNTMVQGQLKRTVSTELCKTYHPNFVFTPFHEGGPRVYRAWKYKTNV